MGLINPSPGEMLDRLTILRLKMGTTMTTGKLETERSMLETQLKVWTEPLNAETGTEERQNKIREFRKQLDQTNSAICRLDEEVRSIAKNNRGLFASSYDPNDVYRLADIAIQLSDLQSSKVSTIKMIDTFFGQTSREY